MNLVFLGRVGRPHGIDGELYVDRISLSAEELEGLGRVEWRGREDAHRALTIDVVRATHARLLVRFRGIRNREDAAELVNGELWIDPARLPDPGPGVAYTYQLVGLRVVDVAGRALGVLRAVQTAGPQPLYIVDHDGREMLIPGIEPFVKRVDLAGGVVTVELPPGFEDLNG
jgi:16S rRNA processing protein RimM